VAVSGPKPAVWPGNGGYVYVPTAGTAGFQTNGGSLDVLQRVVSNAGVVSFQLVGQTANSGDTFGYGSGTPIVTSNGRDIWFGGRVDHSRQQLERDRLST
jgi:hypothetical protein